MSPIRKPFFRRPFSRFIIVASAAASIPPVLGGIA